MEMGKSFNVHSSHDEANIIETDVAVLTKT